MEKEEEEVISVREDSKARSEEQSDIISDELTTLETTMDYR